MVHNSALMHKAPVLPTEKQIVFIHKLQESKDWSGVSGFGDLSSPVGPEDFDRKEASALISALLAAPTASAKKALSPEDLKALEGIHQNASGEVFKVQISQQSGRPYAKKLVQGSGHCPKHLDYSVSPSAFDAPMIQHQRPEECAHWVPGKWEFVYAPAAIHALSEETRMSGDVASHFGKLYGVCCVCARVLTDEKSIAAGIGPVCASKLEGWS
jgi:hypothetical protein